MIQSIKVCLSAKSPRRNNAFTLIELLIVIAIIALLVSILLPSLNKAKELAKEVNCQSCLRTSGYASMLYSSDNDGIIAIYLYTGSDHYWSSFLVDGGYLQEWAAVICPTLPPDRAWGYDKYRTYGVNMYLPTDANVSFSSGSHVGQYLAIERVYDPSSYLHLMDSAFGEGNPCSGTAWYGMQNGVIYCHSANIASAHFRHSDGNRMNTWCIGGNVEICTKESFAQMIRKDRNDIPAVWALSMELWPEQLY